MGTIIALGPLSFSITDGVLRHLRWHGVELLRGISAPIRDTSWGTLVERDVDQAAWETPCGWTCRRRYTVADGAIAAELTFDAARDGRLTASLALDIRRDVSVNRAGFCLLHPLDGVVGCEGTVVGPSGRSMPFIFPERIAPAQPARDITGLIHDVHGVRVTIEMVGETFEMEDQRNWSDASFKTYCRPLSRPLPQRLAVGKRIEQRVTVTLDGVPHTQAKAARRATGTDARMPEVLLALRPGWLPQTGAPWPGGRGLLRIGVGSDWSDADLARLAAMLPDRAPDLEVVLAANGDPYAALAALAGRLAGAGLRACHVSALPAPYLRSIQPEGPWPDGPTPEEAAAAARAAFPDARIGAGMLTNFTELNRRPVAGGDFVTHGNAAIVHAADDRSVLETLGALPAVMHSARAIAGNRGYRLGLVAIAMPSNPYGATLTENPDGQRMTMTDTDPRQATAFAASYAVAVAAIAAQAGAEAIALAAPAGPFGVADADGPHPIAAAIHALASMTGAEVRISGTPPGPVEIVAGSRRIAIAAADAEPTYEGFATGSGEVA